MLKLEPQSSNCMKWIAMLQQRSQNEYCQSVTEVWANHQLHDTHITRGEWGKIFPVSFEFLQIRIDSGKVCHSPPPQPGLHLPKKSHPTRGRTHPLSLGN